MSVFDILREKLKEKEKEHLHDEKVMQALGRNNLSSFCAAKAYAVGGAIEIINQVEKEYQDGWIPAEQPPKDDNPVLLSFANFSVPLVGRYDKDEDGSGAYFVGDEDEPLVKQDIFVNAWQPLPKQYQPQEGA